MGVNPNAPKALNEFVLQNAFAVEVTLLDTDTVTPLPDLSASVRSWSFDLALDGGELDASDDEDTEDDDDDEDDDEGSDITFGADAEDEDDDEDEDPSDMNALGELRLVYQVNRDTIMQAGLLGESAAIKVKIVYRDSTGAPVFGHELCGILDEAHINIGGAISDPADPLTDTLVISVYSLELWTPVAA